MKIIKNIVIILMILLFTCGCSDDNSNEDKLNPKVASEIEFFDSKIVDMLNNLNNLSFQNYRLTTKKVQLTEQSENTEASGGETAGSGEQNSRNWVSREWSAKFTE